MADVPPTPARVVIPLRRDTEVPQCPDVDRCLLELVREPAPDLLEVIDTGLPSDALNRETTKQVVQTKLIANRRSCHRDYTVRVSLLSAGGPIAIGEGRERTTTVHTRRIHTPSLSVISEGSTTETVEADPAAEPGTTTDVQTIDHGDGTETTITTTVTVNRVRWERRLRGCIDPPEVFLAETPQHLLNARYCGVDGERVALVVFRDVAGTWHVVVETRGGGSAIAPLSRQYTPSGDGLQVSAALSRNLMALYVVASRQSPGGTVGAWEHYTRTASSEWTLYASGVVPRPSDAVSHRPYTVDRDGLVSGYWSAPAAVSSGRDSVGGWCTESGTGYVTSWVSVSYPYVYGGGWDLVRGEYRQARDRAIGCALAGGDLQPVRESMAASSSRLLQQNHYEWDTGGFAGWHKTRDQSGDYDTGLRFSISAGGEGIGESQEFGETLNFSGGVDYQVKVVDGSNCLLDVTFDFQTYALREGFAVAAVTAGGWCVLESEAEVTTADLSTHSYTDGPFFCTNVPFPCPDILGTLGGLNRLSTGTERSRLVMHPVSIPAGDAIVASCTAIDQESGDWYAAALVQEGAVSTWHIFRNGVDVSAAVVACTGRPAEQFHAIYWRA